jgi:hypothetical protein
MAMGEDDGCASPHLWMPGIGGIRNGGLLVQEPAHRQGVHTWEEFLAERVTDRGGKGIW